MAMTTTSVLVGGVPPSASQAQPQLESSGSVGSGDYSKTHWARRWFVGFMTALLFVGSAGSTWNAPKAEAQAGGLAAAIAAAKGAEEICKIIYGSEGLRECLDSGVEDIENITELGKCVADTVGKDNDNGGEEGETPPPTSGEGGDERKQADSALKECMEKLKKDDDEVEDSAKTPDDYSLYRMSSALTAFYVNSLIPGGDKDSSTGGDDTEGEEGTESEASAGLNAWGSLLEKGGMAGAFVAAPSKDFLENKNWLLGSGDAKNDAVFSYNSFTRDPGDVDAGVSTYVHYGALLDGLGFDNTSARDSMDIARNKVMGYGVMVAFVGAGFVDTLFDGIVEILAKTNPFGIMVDAITPHTNASFTEGMRSDAVNEGGNFDELKHFIGRMYDGFVQIGWLVTIPVFIGLAIAGMLLSRRYAVGEGLKKIFIRVGFLVVGIPLLGVTYTAGLDSMQGASGEANSANAAKIVNSTYLDFESWVNESRLDLPGDVSTLSWDTKEQRPSEETQAQARRNTLIINRENVEGLRDLLKENSSGNVDMSIATESIRDGKDGKGSSLSANAATLSMLNRYISGETISSAAYESQVKGALTKMAESNPDAASEILGWVKDFTSADSISSMSAEEVRNLKNPLIKVNGVSAMSGGIDRSGEIRFEGTGGGNGGSVGYRGCYPGRIVTGGSNPADGEPAACSMSTLSMYNYLNTSFGASSATTFSPDNSTSAWTREQHQSVNAIGSGMMSFIYWFSAIVLLGSFALIGFIYGLAMMFNVIKRSVLLIAAVPFATMGFIAGITKVIVYTIAMFLELFMTLFVYKVVQEFLMTIPSLIEKPIVGMASESSKTIAVMGITVLSSIGIIIFTVIAVKLRSSLTQAMDEASTNAINKMVGTGVSSASDPAAGGGLKAGIARGAAMGAASRMMGGGSDGGEAVADSVDASGADMGAAAVAGSGAGTALGTDMDPQGIDSDNADVEGNGIVDPNAANVDTDGAEQDQLPAGEYDVDGDGDLVDADGNPVMNADGSNANIGDVAGVDDDGYITDANGQPVIGEDGDPIHSSDVEGIDRHGNLMGKDGALTDENGNFIRAGGVGSVDDNNSGGASPLIGDTSLDADEATAAAMAENGGLDPSLIQSSSSLPTADAADGESQFGTALGGGGRAAAAGAAAMNAANGYANSAGASQGAQDVINGAQGTDGAATAFQQASGNAQVVSGGAPGQVAPQQLGAQPAQAPGVQAPQQVGSQNSSAPAGASGGSHTSGGNGANPMMGFIGMQMANQAANKVTGQTKAGKTIHESVTGSRGGGQPASGGGAPMMSSPRQKRGGQGANMATMAGMQATNGGSKKNGPRRSRGSGSQSTGLSARGQSLSDGLHTQGTDPQRSQGPRSSGGSDGTGNGMTGL